EDQNIRLMRERIAPAAVALHRVRKPTLAMVEGVAVGAGCNLALGCDVVYAAEDARFSQIFVHRGLSLDFGGSWILPRLVGIQKARELALFGDQIPAPEAAAMGMIAGTEPPERLASFVRDRAKQLTQRSPLALATIKQVLHESESLSFADAVDREFVLQGRCVTSEDSREAVKAFFEKRPPNFNRPSGEEPSGSR
ncbi:enoyl-CoA hydratase-related protein, partial [Myxococcota bacterium]|nr:enoyl-CoA hydratase-related protein [Myxococcota bacterium]